MSNNPSVLLAQTIQLDGPYTIDVQDSHSTRTVTIVAGGATRYARVLLAKGSDTGTTVGAPLELLSTIQTALNAAPATLLWQLALDSSGRVSITYTGSGTGHLTFNQTALQSLLGWLGGFSASASTVYGTIPPKACLVAVCADESDTDWQVRPTGVAAAETQAGVTYAVDSGNRAIVRAIRLRMLPRTGSEVDAGEYLTPALPADEAASSTRWTAPSTTAWTTAGYYTAHEFVATAHRLPGAQCGFCIGTLQEYLSGSGGFVVGSISAETLRSEETFPLSVEGFYKYRDCVLRVTRTKFVDA